MTPEPPIDEPDRETDDGDFCDWCANCGDACQCDRAYDTYRDEEILRCNS